MYPGEHNLETIHAHLPAMLTFAGRSLAAGGPGRACGGLTAVRPAGAGASALGAYAVGALAGGAVAVGAMAIGHLAIGRLAVGRLAVGRFAVGRLALKSARGGEIVLDSLEVGQAEGRRARGRAPCRRRAERRLSAADRIHGENWPVSQ